MAWLVSSRIDNSQPKMALFPEDDERYNTMRKQVQKDQNLWGVSEFGMMRGFRYPLPVHPIRMNLRTEARSLPKLFGARLSWAVSQELIGIIEDLEPGVHRYWPIELFQPDGALTEPRWLVNICNRLDTIAVAQSDVVLLKTPKGTPTQIAPRFTPLVVSREGSGPQHLVMSKEKISSHCLWCEPLYGNHIFISDQLADAFRANGVDGLQFEMETGEV